MSKPFCYFDCLNEETSDTIDQTLNIIYLIWKYASLGSPYLIIELAQIIDRHRVNKIMCMYNKGAFTNYVHNSLAFLWPPTPLRWHFLLLKSPHFWTTYPPTSSCHRSLWTTLVEIRLFSYQPFLTWRTSLAWRLSVRKDKLRPTAVELPPQGISLCKCRIR